MKRLLLIAIPIVLLLALVGWRYSQKVSADAANKKQSAARRNAAAVVSLATAGPATLQQTLQAIGSLESPYTVKLSPNVAGRIQYLEVREGDPVLAGQVLARIDPNEVEAQIVQAESTLAESQQKLSQARITQNANTAGINSTVSQQKAAVASSNADYNEVQATYEATVGSAHQATLDAQAKVSSAQANVETTQANLSLAQANLNNSRAHYAREYSLYVQGFVAPQDLEDQRAAVQVNEAQVTAQSRVVNAAQSALASSRAQYQAAVNQESIVRKKGRSDIQDAKAKLTQSQATLTSAVANRSQIPAYVENLRALSSEVSVARAALNQAIARRSYLIVKASINGTVTQRLADPGAEASPGSALLVIQYLKWLYVTSAVPVEYADQVRTGLEVLISIDGLPGKVFRSRITDINKSADPASRQFMVRLKLDNSQGILRPGMFARLNMVTSSTDAPVAVPREAVATDNTGNSTATVVDQQMIAHLVPIKIGAQDATRVQILSGVNPGDKVVILTYRAVKDGSKVVDAASAGGNGKGGNGRRGGRAAGRAGTAGASGSGGANVGAAGASGTGTGGGASPPASGTAQAGSSPGSGGQGATSPVGTGGVGTTSGASQGVGTTGSAGVGGTGGTASLGGTVGTAGTAGAVGAGAAAANGAAGGGH